MDILIKYEVQIRKFNIYIYIKPLLSPVHILVKVTSVLPSLIALMIEMCFSDEGETSLSVRSNKHVCCKHTHRGHGNHKLPKGTPLSATDGTQ